MKNIIIAIAAILVLASCTADKTAYVDTTILLKEYNEMKDADKKYTARSERLKKQLDSVAQEFQIEVQDFQKRAARLSASKRQNEEQTLLQKQQTLQQQQQFRSQQLRQESDAVIDSIITKVKDYVKVYGENNGYTYIFGSNETANIMYAKEGLDITDDVLEKLNSEYKSN